MNLLRVKKSLRVFTDLKFAIVILMTIAIASSLGSFIEQDENLEFYQENYPLNKPIYGFITWKTIILLGLDHVYINWWFLILLLILGICVFGILINKLPQNHYPNQKMFTDIIAPNKRSVSVKQTKKQ